MQKMKELLTEYYDYIKKNQAKRNSQTSKKISYEKEGEAYKLESKVTPDELEKKAAEN